MTAETRLKDAAALEALLDDLAEQLAEEIVPETPLAMIGVRTRGVPIADRLAARLAMRLGRPVPVGAVDITLYRDDLDQALRWPELRGTDILFPIEGAEIVLVDDVLQTGRTIRAALNAVCDLGRPARVRLAVVVDRGRREFPIQPDVIGFRYTARPNHRVRVRVRPIDAVDEIVQVSLDP